MADVSFFSPYAVGGATRPDSFTNLDPLMRSRLMEMLMAAKEELGPDALRITSAYRSPELQGQLYQEALKKYGTPEETRRWVAPAGRSQHNFGTAVDFANLEGQLLRDPNSPEAKWLKANAARFGLAVPLANEPWQVELEGARSGNISQGQQMRLSTKDAPMTPNQPKNLWERLTTTGERSGLNPMEAFAAALDPLIHPEMRGGSAIRQMGAQRAAFAKEEKAKNRTIEMLKAKANAGDTIASQVLGALDSGAIDTKTAMSLYLGKQFETPKDTRTAQIQNYEYWKSKGYSDEEAAKMVKSGQTISIGDKQTLLEQLRKDEAGNFAKYTAAGDLAKQQLKDFAVLKELLSGTPSTAAQGYIAEAFPKFANDATQVTMAIIKRIAPTLRVEGSGSTSDIEYQGMLDSLGSMMNSPEARAAIYDIMAAKAQFNVNRSDLIRSFSSGQIDENKLFEGLSKLEVPDTQLAERIKSVTNKFGGVSSGSFEFKTDTGVEWGRN